MKRKTHNLEIIEAPTKKGLIYALTDKRDISHIRYIGKTEISLKKRIQTHIYEARGGNQTYKARWIRHIGEENLNVFVIAETNSSNKLNELEIYYIKYLRELNHALTNASSGGEGATGVKKSKETKIKISDSLKGNQRAKGYEHTEETKKKLGKAIYQLDKTTGEIIKEYSWLVDAANQLNGDVANISACCRGKVQTAYGYKWCFVSEYENYISAEYRSRSKPVYQIDKNTGEILKEYKSASDAARETNNSIWNIIEWCKHMPRTITGYIWAYVENYKNGKEHTKARPIKIIYQIDKTTDEIIKEWESTKVASEQLNIDKTSIKKCCAGKQNSAGGYKWRYK